MFCAQTTRRCGNITHLLTAAPQASGEFIDPSRQREWRHNLEMADRIDHVLDARVLPWPAESYTLVAVAPVPDLRASHPRGDGQFAEDDLAQRWEESLHHRAMVSTMRRNLIPASDKPDDPETPTK